MKWKDERRYISYTLWFIIIASTIYTSQKDYLLFHSIAELFAVVIAFCIFVILFNSLPYQNKGFMIILGFGYACVGLFDFIHMLSYEGMGLFTEFTSNLPTQLWIMGRFFESITILAASVFIIRRVNARYVAGIYAITTVMLLLSVFRWGIFPDCLVQPDGLTTFKIVSEYIIIAILAGALIYNIKYNRGLISTNAFYYAIAAIILKIIAELFFTMYVGVYDEFNMVGHVFKYISYYFIYRAVVQLSIREPYEELQVSKDELFESREQYKQLSEQLEQKVKERTSQLEDAIKELEAFSYSVSHDLREPLRGIDGFSLALLEDYTETLDDQGKHYLNRIRAATKRMGQLINDILNLSRLNRTPLAVKEVDISLLVSNVVNQLQEHNPERKLQFLVQDNVMARCDRRLIQIVFENLLGNAVKYTSKKQEAIIEFGVEQQDNARLFYIKDNGCGFDMAYYNKLFVAFQRLHSAKEYEGTGIGLALVNSVIRRHGGSVWAESIVDQGTTFYFTIKERID
jgi:signal transduction histidine kinase